MSLLWNGYIPLAYFMEMRKEVLKQAYCVMDGFADADLFGKLELHPPVWKKLVKTSFGELVELMESMFPGVKTLM